MNTHFNRQYLIELGSALALYFGLLVGGIKADQYFHFEGPVRFLVAAAPMIGCVLALIAIMRRIRKMDEFQRRIQFEALVFGFASTAMITLTWGFLEGAGAPRFPVFGVWPLMGFTWFIGGVIAKLRYR
jgi:hypothetical protein